MVDGKHSLRLPSSKPFRGPANGQSWPGCNAKESPRTLVDLNQKAQLFRHDDEKVGEGEGETKGKEGTSDARQPENEEGRAGHARPLYSVFAYC